jgi:O-antigen/teichoic acid export membrane protein
MTVLTSAGVADTDQRASATDRLLNLVTRYGLSAFGPIAVSGAHFVASIVFLHAFSRSDFGLFSFLLVIVPFCLSLNGALLGPSITSRDAKSGMTVAEDTGMHLKISLVFALAASVAVFLLTLTIRAQPELAAILGCYGGMMTLRWVGRCYAYRHHRPLRAVSSDFAYSAVVVVATVTLSMLHQLTAMYAAIILFGAAASGLIVFGRDYLARQFWPGRDGSLRAYGLVWRDMTRWSLMGVALTEITANAHAYLVTLISGPGAFALLAIGTLLMRPVSLVYAALPDVERPAIARAIAAGDHARAFRIVKEFRTAVGAMWVATVLAASTILIWFPHLVLKNGYGQGQALTVAAFFAAIMAVRAVRTPESVFLQAAREYRPLARASLWSSLVSLVATLLLLLAAGPIASLGGILAGEALMTVNILALSRRWRASHG